MIKNYKEFHKIGLGCSDIASLVLRGGVPGDIAEIHFGRDGSYSAYLVTEKAEIGIHYDKVFETKNWLWVYDDTERTVSITAPEIRVYRSGEMGCIIEAVQEQC